MLAEVAVKKQKYLVPKHYIAASYQTLLSLRFPTSKTSKTSAGVEMQASIGIPTSSTSHSLLKPITNPLLGHSLFSRPCLPLKRRASFTTKALVSTTKESVLKDFHERRALKVHQTCQVFPFSPLGLTQPEPCIYFRWYPTVPMWFYCADYFRFAEFWQRKCCISHYCCRTGLFVSHTRSINRWWDELIDKLISSSNFVVTM